jgi:hypothetical protein
VDDRLLIVQILSSEEDDNDGTRERSNVGNSDAIDPADNKDTPDTEEGGNIGDDLRHTDAEPTSTETGNVCFPNAILCPPRSNNVQEVTLILTTSHSIVWPENV